MLRNAEHVRQHIPEKISRSQIFAVEKYEQSASLMTRSMQGPSPWFGSFLGHFQHSPFGLSIFFLYFFSLLGQKKKSLAFSTRFVFFFFFARDFSTQAPKIPKNSTSLGGGWEEFISPLFGANCCSKLIFLIYLCSDLLCQLCPKLGAGDAVMIMS